MAKNVLPTPGLPMRITLVPFCEKVEIQQAQDASLYSASALVMVEVEAVDAGAAPVTATDGSGARWIGHCALPVPCRRALPASAEQLRFLPAASEIVWSSWWLMVVRFSWFSFVFQWRHRDSFRDRRMKASYSASESGSVASSFKFADRGAGAVAGLRGADCCCRRMLAM